MSFPKPLIIANDNVWAFDSTTVATSESWGNTNSSPSGRKKQLDIGDLHGNFLKLLKPLLQTGVVSLAEGTDYEELVRIENIAPHLLEQEDFNKFKAIIDRLIIKDPQVLVTLYGDTKGDRGSNDYYTKYLLKKLKKENIVTKTIFSNHDFHALFPEFETITDEPKYSSYINEQVLLDRGLITQRELDEFNQDYFESLQLLSYKIEKDQHGKITAFNITAHAFEGTGPENIAAVAEYFGITPRLDTIAHIAKTIDAINAKFRQQMKDPAKRKTLAAKIADDTLDHQINLNDPEENELEKYKAHKKAHPFYGLMFSYDTYDTWGDIEGIVPIQSHGHIGQSTKADKATQINLDGSAGQNNLPLIDLGCEPTITFIAANEVLPLSCQLNKNDNLAQYSIFYKKTANTIEYKIFAKLKLPILSIKEGELTDPVDNVLYLYIKDNNVHCFFKNNSTPITGKLTLDEATTDSVKLAINSANNYASPIISQDDISTILNVIQTTHPDTNLFQTKHLSGTISNEFKNTTTLFTAFTSLPTDQASQTKKQKSSILGHIALLHRAELCQQMGRNTPNQQAQNPLLFSYAYTSVDEKIERIHTLATQEISCATFTAWAEHKHVQKDATENPFISAVQKMMDQKINKRLKKLNQWLHLKNIEKNQWESILQLWTTCLGELSQLQIILSDSQETPIRPNRIKELFAFLDHAIDLAKRGEFKAANTTIDLVKDITSALSSYYSPENNAASDVKADPVPTTANKSDTLVSTISTAIGNAKTKGLDERTHSNSMKWFRRLWEYLKSATQTSSSPLSDTNSNDTNLSKTSNEAGSSLKHTWGMHFQPATEATKRLKKFVDHFGKDNGLTSQNTMGKGG